MYTKLKSTRGINENIETSPYVSKSLKLKALKTLCRSTVLFSTDQILRILIIMLLGIRESEDTYTFFLLVRDVKSMLVRWKMGCTLKKCA